MKPIVVVGAGFSGLTLAHALVERGLPVQIIERHGQVGGLIGTRHTSLGLVETAANALMANGEIEQLFTSLNLKFAEPLRARKNRYVFWQKPRRWPLSFATSLRLLKLLIGKILHLPFVQPRALESVSAWARRVVDPQFEVRLLAPALQGVYAGDLKRMSASLVVRRFLQKSKLRRGQLRGSVAPCGGMGELMDRLEQSLRERGVQFQMQQEFTLAGDLREPTVLCTSAWGAEQILRPRFAAAAEILSCCQSLPLISVTVFFEPSVRDLEGFGCLFPEEQRFSALGVLFNSCIFSERSTKRSETWIFGGAKRADLLKLSDAQLRALLHEDRRRLCGSAQDPLAVHITRWPQAIPHYTVEWESALQKLILPRLVYLHGNYLGQLGLAQIYRRSLELAAQIEVAYVN